MSWLFKALLFKALIIVESLGFICSAAEKNTLNDKEIFGIIATDPSLHEKAKELSLDPPLSNTKKSYCTYNRFGFDILDDEHIQQNWLIQRLQTFAGTPQEPILDIGGGYGGISRLLLEQGAAVIYNDIEIKHLLFGLRKIKDNALNRVYLNTQAFPMDMNFPDQSLAAVVLHRVLHFMSPNEIEKGIKKIFQWLVPGGRVFIVVLAPQHQEYREKVLPVYDTLWQQGNEWPGNNLLSSEILPSQAYALPEYLHVMDERPLKRVLDKYGFQIEKYDFISLQKYGNSTERDGKEAFGIIAFKPSL